MYIDTLVDPECMSHENVERRFNKKQLYITVATITMNKQEKNASFTVSAISQPELKE